MSRFLDRYLPFLPNGRSAPESVRLSYREILIGQHREALRLARTVRLLGVHPYARPVSHERWLERAAHIRKLIIWATEKPDPWG